MIQKKDSSYFTAVITPPAQIHITLPVPETKIQSMLSDSLVRQSTKSKGPPPPVPKKPKNPFGKDVAHAIDKPLSYSDLLQKNIKMGRRESALYYITQGLDKSPSDLDMSFCPGNLDSSRYMTEGFDPGLQPELAVPTIYSGLDSEGMDLWTKIVDILPEPGGVDINQIKHTLKKPSKMKGPPPPVPKKPLNPFVAIERDTALPINISKKTAGILSYESCDYKPYMHRPVHEEELKTNSATDRDNFLVNYGNSNTLDEVFLRFRPELIRQTDNVHKIRTPQSSRANVGNQGNKVLEITKTSDVKKAFSCPMEIRPSPKKGESIL